MKLNYFVNKQKLFSKETKLSPVQLDSHSLSSPCLSSTFRLLWDKSSSLKQLLLVLEAAVLKEWKKVMSRGDLIPQADKLSVWSVLLSLAARRRVAVLEASMAVFPANTRTDRLESFNSLKKKNKAMFFRSVGIKTQHQFQSRNYW